MTAKYIANFNLKNSIAIVTGANQGIGLATSKALAAMHSKVIMTGRHPDHLQQAASELPSSDQSPVAIPLDLADLNSVDRFLQAYMETGPSTASLHLLIHNAGLMLKQRSVTADGFETALQVNYLAPTYLTLSLLRAYHEASQQGTLSLKGKELRVVHVNTGLHAKAKLNMDDLQSEKSPYIGFNAYASAKLAQVVFSNFLQRVYDQGASSVGDESLAFIDDLKQSGLVLRTAALDPGWVKTNLVRKDHGFTDADHKKLMGGAKKTPEEGALTTLAVCTAAELKGGTFWMNEKVAKSGPQTLDASVQDGLWAATRDMLEWS